MLSLTNIQKSFHQNTPNEMKLFDHFNLKIKQGEFVVVVGSNGSGKSTLLNLIDGNLSVDGGSIQFMEQEITGQPSYLRSRDISRVYQDPSKGTSPTLTIRENMSLAMSKGRRYGLSAGINRSQEDEIKSLLKLLDLNLEHKLDVKVGLLSGGQRQALGLLMAVCCKPKLLLLDEHTAALDPKASAHIMALTDKLVQEFKMTTLMITHQLKDALAFGNRCVMLHLGKSVLDVSGSRKQEMKAVELMSLFHELTI